MNMLDKWFRQLDDAMGVGQIPGATTGETPPIVGQAFGRMVDGWDDVREGGGFDRDVKGPVQDVLAPVAPMAKGQLFGGNTVASVDGGNSWFGIPYHEIDWCRRAADCVDNGKGRGLVDSMKSYELTPRRATFKATEFGPWVLEYGTEVGKGTVTFDESCTAPIERD
jgi:hypothetical protein